MRRLAALVTVVVMVVAPSASASVTSDVPAAPTPGPVQLEFLPGASAPPVTSENVTYHGTIPIDSPAVGGEVVNHINGNRYFYATGLKGLSIYDISDPEVPVLAGYLPLPHSQNEDLKVSEDGTRAVIAADGALLVSIMPLTVGLHVIDTTDPTDPAVLGHINSSNHTVECADPECEWLYGSSGRIYDARTPAAIVEVGRWNLDRFGNSIGSGHALRRDETGIVISDSNPRLILDPRTPPADPNDPNPPVDEAEAVPGPAHPLLLAQGARRASIDSRLQHNNVRPDADEWVSRVPGNPADAVTHVTIVPGARSVSGTNKRPVLRPGELLIGNAESNLNPTCSSAGGLSTWSIANFDHGAAPEQLEVFRPLNGTALDGSPRANALGCSGHWFTENDGIVAASWYEHGVHFFNVNKENGAIREIGYFQPMVTEAGAAYWVDDTHVYNVDYARGIDILSFDRSDELPGQRELDRTWARNLDRVGVLASAERYACRAATSGVERPIRVKK
jgi:hypothetical protein